MTLKQLEYVVTAARCKSLHEAANELFIAQPSLTSAIRELENEMGISIFLRTNKGITVSKEGEVFLSYARQLLEQANEINEKFKGAPSAKRQFCVSAQHYSFAVNAFVDLIKQFGGDKYDFSIRETQTYEIIEDVARLKSEIGVLYLDSFNSNALKKIIKANDLEFFELFTAKPHIFVGRENPLAKRKSVTFAELEKYPYLSFEQGEHNSLYYSEEIFSSETHSKNIRVRDRATLFNLLIGLDGYTVCSGVIDNRLNGDNIAAVELGEAGEMHIGYILHKNVRTGSLCKAYIENLKKYTEIE